MKRIVPVLVMLGIIAALDPKAISLYITLGAICLGVFLLFAAITGNTK